MTSGDSRSPIIFFGTDEHSLIVLRALLDADLPVAAIVTKPDSVRGRGKKLLPPAVKEFAAVHNIRVLQPQKVHEIIEYLQSLQHPVGVLASYGKIIPQSVLDLFSPGIINIHPSLLPRYRGSSPIESAIANRDTATGVSLMRLVAAMDAGPLYKQQVYPLTETETKPQLYNTLFSLGTHLLIDTLPDIISGHQIAEPQQDNAATYCPQLQKSDGVLDPATMSANTAEAHVRAYLGFPRTYFTVNGRSLIIVQAHVSSKQETPLDARYADGAFLAIDKLIAPSGKTMTANAYLLGHPF